MAKGMDTYFGKKYGKSYTQLKDTDKSGMDTYFSKKYGEEYTSLLDKKQPTTTKTVDDEKAQQAYDSYKQNSSILDGLLSDSSMKKYETERYYAKQKALSDLKAAGYDSIDDYSKHKSDLYYEKRDNAVTKAGESSAKLGKANSELSALQDAMQGFALSGNTFGQIRLAKEVESASKKKKEAIKELSEKGYSDEDISKLSQYEKEKADEEYAKYMTMQAADSPIISSYATSVISPVRKTLDTVATLTQGLENISKADKEAPTNLNNKYTWLGQYADASKAYAKENINNYRFSENDTVNKVAQKVAGFAFDASTQGIESMTDYLAASGAATTFLSGVGIGSKKALNEVSKQIVQTQYGFSSYQSGYRDARERGLSEEQAQVEAFATGAIEYLTEQIGADMFFKSDLKDLSAKSIIKSLAAQGAAEGTEEVFGNIATLVVDNLVAGKQSEYWVNVDKYMKQGMSREEAEREAALDFAKDTAYQFAVAFASAGAPVGAKMVSAKASYTNTASSIESDSEKKQRIHEAAQKMPEGTKAKEIASSKTAEELTKNDIADTLFSMDQENTSIEDRLLQSLEEKGERPEQAKVEAKAIMDFASDDITEEERTEIAKTILSSEAAKQTFEELRDGKLATPMDVSRDIQAEIMEDSKSDNKTKIYTKDSEAIKAKDGSTITGIKLGDNNEVMFVTENNNVVPREDLTFKNSNYQRVVDAVANSSLFPTIEAKNAAISEYDGAIPAALYTEGFATFVNAGANGIKSYEESLKTNQKYVAVFDESNSKILQMAYNIGENIKANNAAVNESEYKKDLETTKAAKGNKGKKGGSYENNKTVEGNNSVSEFVKRVSKLSGINISEEDIYFGNNEIGTVNGYFDIKDNTIKLFAYNLVDNQERENNELATMVHEIMESLRSYDVDKAKQIEDLAIETLNQKLSDKELYELIENYRSAYGTTQELARGELARDVVSGIFLDEKYLDKFVEHVMQKEDMSASEKQGVFASLADFFKNLAAKLKEYVLNHISAGQITAGTKEGMDLALERAYECDRITDMFLNAIDTLNANAIPSVSEISMSKPVERKKNLIAVHNLTEDKLEKALQYDEGMPMISIAVTTDEIGHENFGDISLFLNAKSIDPSNRKNKVYPTDAWTPTFPRIEYEVDMSKLRDISKKVSEIDNIHPDFDPSQFVNGLEYQIDSYGGEQGIVEMAYNNTRMQAAYLASIGETIEYKKTVNRKELTDAQVEMSEEFIKEFGDLIPEMARKSGRDTIGEYGERIDSVIKDTYKKWGIDADIIDDCVNDLKGLDKIRYIRQARDYMQNGRVIEETVIDYGGTNTDIANRAQTDQYRKWLENLFAGIEKDSGLYNGADIFTPSGNRKSFKQTHLPVTASNIVKAMLAQSDDVKNVSGFHGVKSIRAAVGKPFKSIVDIRNAAEKLKTIDEETYNNTEERLNKELSELLHKLASQKNPDNIFIAVDYVGEDLLEICEKDYSVDNIISTFDKYGYKVTNADAKKLNRIIDEVANMPVNMFEAKPERVITWSEFDSALVPQDKESAIKALEAKGIKVFTYDSSIENARQGILESDIVPKFSRNVPYTKDGFIKPAAEQIKATDEKRLKDERYFDSRGKRQYVPIGFENALLDASDYVPYRDIIEAHKKMIIEQTEYQKNHAVHFEDSVVHNGHVFRYHGYGNSDFEVIDIYGGTSQYARIQQKLRNINKRTVHERIERRTGGTYISDSSSNGSKNNDDSMASREGTGELQGNKRLYPFDSTPSDKQSRAVINDIGYHAGDLGKAEYYGSQGGSRGTGHFGTGTYFVGNEANINIGGYKDRPHHIVDFSKYNLYRVLDTNAGLELHDALKVLDAENIKKEWIKPASKWDYSFVSTTDFFDYLEEKFGTKYDSDLGISFVNDEAYDPDKRMKAAQEYIKAKGFEYVSYKEYAKEVEEPNKKDYADYIIDRFKEDAEKENNAYAKFRDAYSIFKYSVGFEKDLNKALENTVDYIESKPEAKADSVATFFMKQLGYEGIDVRHTNLDDTEYGSVIYDVRPDTRFSLNDIGKVREDEFNNIETTEVEDILAEGFKSMKDSEVNRAGIKRIANQLLKKYQSKYDADILTENLYRIFSYIQKNGTVDYNDMLRVASEVAMPVLESRQSIDKGLDAQYQEFKKYVKSYKIKLSEAQINEAKFKYGNSFKADNRKYINFNDKEGIELDSIWSDIVAHSNGFLQEDVADVEQALMLADALRMMDEGRYTDTAAGMNKETQSYDMALEIFQNYFTSANNPAINKELGRIKREKERYEKKLKENYEKRLQNITDRRVGKVKAAYENRTFKANESKQAKEYRGKINKVVKDLNKKLLRPSKDNHLPVDMVKATVDFLDVMNNVNDKIDPVKAYKLSQAYAATAEDMEFGEYDPHTKQMIDNLVDILGEKSFSQLNLAELKQVYEVAKAIQRQVQQANKLLSMQDARNVYELRRDAIKDVQNSKGYDPKNVLSRFNNAYMSQALNAERFVRRIANYNDESPLVKLMEGIKRGELQKYDFQRQAAQIYADVTEGKQNAKDFKKFISTKAEDLVGIGLYKGGKELQVPMSYRAALAMHIMNEDNLRHIVHGGLTIPDAELLKKGKVQEAYDKGETYHVFNEDEVRAAQKAVDNAKNALADLKASKNTMSDAEYRKKLVDARNLVADTERELAKLYDEGAEVFKGFEDRLTDYEKRFVENAKEYFHNFTGSKINEVSLKLKGYKLAQVENYFPIVVDSDYLTTSAEFDAIIADAGLESYGFLKERVTSTKPLLLEDITKVIERQNQNVSTYYGYAIPVRDFKKVMNTNANYASLSKEIKLKWGKTATDYLDNFFKSLRSNGNKNWFNKIISNLRSMNAVSALSLNVKVAASQAASYPTAAATVGWKPLVKALKDMPKGFTEKGIAEVESRTPLLWYRLQGYNTQEIGDLKQKGIKLPKWLDWITAIDTKTVRTLEYAAKYYVDDTMPNMKKGSEQYWNEVTKVFNDIIRETQPNYTEVERAAINRTESDILKSLVMYKTQPFQNFGILEDSLGALGARQRDLKANPTAENKAAVAKAKKKVALAVSSQVIAQAVYVGMRALIAAFVYRKDEDKDTEEVDGYNKEYFINNALSSIAGMFIFGDLIYEYVASKIFDTKYYGVDVTQIEAINNVTDNFDYWQSALDKYNDAVTDSDKEKAKINLMTRSRKLAFTIGTLFGIPANNVYNLIEGVVKNVQNASGLPETGITKDASTVDSQYELMQKAVEANDMAEYKRLLEQRVDKYFEENDSDKTREEQLKYYANAMVNDLYKDAYIDAYKSNRSKAIELQQQIIKAMTYAGYSKDDVLKKLNKWVK